MAKLDSFWSIAGAVSIRAKVVGIVTICILMAATLIHIKARLLLPRDENDPEEEDPRDELILALLEYKKYKEAGEILRDRALIEGMRAPGMNAIAHNILRIATDGLRNRGFDEERLLEPIERRIVDRTSPAFAKLCAFEMSGLQGLLRHIFP